MPNRKELLPRKGLLISYEMRLCDVKPGMLEACLKLFDDVGMPECRAHDNLAGFWSTEFGALNQVIRIWRYKSLDRR